MQSPFADHGKTKEMSLKLPFASFNELINYTVHHYGLRTALSSFGTELSFFELDGLSRSFANYCWEELKLKKGDRIAIMLPNLISYPIALFGALRIGLVVVNINPFYQSKEFGHQIIDSGATSLVILQDLLNKNQDSFDFRQIKNLITVEGGDLLSPIKRRFVNFSFRRSIKPIKPANLTTIQFKQLLSDGAEMTSTWSEKLCCHDDLALLQYTGGTTGHCRGARLRIRNILSNIEMCYEWLKPLLQEQISTQETILTPLPLYHIFSLVTNLFLGVRTGNKIVLVTNPLRIKDMVKTIDKEKCSFIIGVDTLFAALLKVDKFKKIDFSFLKLGLTGGMVTRQETADAWFKVTGRVLIQGYGMTECSPVVSCAQILSKRFDGSVGKPLHSTEIKIIDNEGRPLPTDQEGELCVRGPQVMDGYWGLTDSENRQWFLADSWLKTGDIGKYDQEGNLRICGRKKELIIISGYNVYPNEIEEILLTHDNIIEAAVSSHSAKNGGNPIIIAFVVSDGSKSIEVSELLALCRENLISYKIPNKVVFCEKLPKTALGKIARNRLFDPEFNRLCYPTSDKDHQH